MNGCRVYDISCGLETVPVSLQSDANKEELANDFEYSPFCVSGPGCNEDDFILTLNGCSCSDKCSLNCPCIKRFGPNYDEFHRLIEQDSKEANLPIVECSDACSCSKTCGNRLVQHGIQFRLQIFNTETKGYGVRSLEFIPKDSFVCEYVGEVINTEEAKKRLALIKPNDKNYIFVLRENTNGRTVHIVDPRDTGNVSRFFNHSCEPNLQVVPVRTGSSVPRLCFFALRDILPYEEITYNYSGNHVSKNGSLPITSLHTLVETKTCLCGSKRCLGKLPFDVIL